MIVSVGGRLSLGFRTATTTIPIVTMVIDPIALGLAVSIARPGGNITGVTIAGGLEIIAKRMGLLVEAIPKLSAVGYLASRPFWDDRRGAAAREAAKQAGISLLPAMLSAFNEAEYQRVFSSMEQARADAFMVSGEPEHGTYRATIVELAAKGRIYPFRANTAETSPHTVSALLRATPTPAKPRKSRQNPAVAGVKTVVYRMAQILAEAAVAANRSPSARFP